MLIFFNIPLFSLINTYNIIHVPLHNLGRPRKFSLYHKLFSLLYKAISNPLDRTLFKVKTPDIKLMETLASKTIKTLTFPGWCQNPRDGFMCLLFLECLFDLFDRQPVSSNLTINFQAPVNFNFQKKIMGNYMI